jgi:hypothetical protein
MEKLIVPVMSSLRFRMIGLKHELKVLVWHGLHTWQKKGNYGA